MIGSCVESVLFFEVTYSIQLLKISLKAIVRYWYMMHMMHASIVEPACLLSYIYIYIFKYAGKAGAQRAKVTLHFYKKHMIIILALGFTYTLSS